MDMRKVTMRDVAMHAGVSTATVSHVINGTHFVSEDRKARVLNSIDELGYQPNEMARTLRTGKKNMIGFIVPDIANEFFAAVIEEVERVIGRNSYKLIITNTHEDEDNEVEAIRALTSGMVDGILIASTAKQFSTIRDVIPNGFPAVLIDRTFPDCSLHSIVISNHAAMYKGVEALIARGHKKIGYIAGLRHISTAAERLVAFKAALTDHGIPIRDDLISFGDSMHNSADAHVGKLLEKGCTAIAISNNAMAEDVIYYCHKHGVKIGTDLDLLTTNMNDRRYYNLGNMGYVLLPALDMARSAGEQIINCINNPNLPIKEIVYPAIYQEL